MITVYLHGNLKAFLQPKGESEGTERNAIPLKFKVNSLNELMRALYSQLPGFKKFLIRKAEKGAAYRITINNRSLSENQLDDPLGSGELHITPVIKGRGGRTGNIIKVIAGVIITAVALITGVGAPIAMIGISLALNGIMGLLSEPPKTPADSEEDDKKSFVFNGAVNSSGVNSRVPVVLGAGRCTGNLNQDGFIIGSMVASGFIRSYSVDNDD